MGNIPPTTNTWSYSVKIGDMVRARWFADDPGLGVIVGESVIENARVPKMFKVLWQIGDCMLVQPKCLKLAHTGER